MNKENYTLRNEVTEQDVLNVGRIVLSTGFFNEEELSVAQELVQERLEKGEESGYEFCFLDSGGETVAYACYGRIPCTKASYDLYWIAADARFQGRGYGRAVLKAVENDIRQKGGTAVYIETSSRPQYLPTQAFYTRNGYTLAVTFPDFYDTDDGKMVFVKRW